MTEQYHSIVGLPLSGKTTFLAAVWHLIDAGEVKTKLVLDKLVGDNAYLNLITDAWRKCEEVPRTSRASETKMTIHLHARDTDLKIALGFPDLSGESFEEQFADRACTADYVSGFAGEGGVLLFVSANRRSDGMTIVDIGPAIEGADEPEQPEIPREWTAQDVPQQVRLVDLLQFLLRPPFPQRCRRLAVIVSAWDVVLEPRPTPDQWLAREMPLLHQFLRNNPGSFDFRAYGISAQGGDVRGDDRLALARQTPGERIQCHGLDADLHDLTAPIFWLSGAGGDG